MSDQIAKFVPVSAETLVKMLVEFKEFRLNVIFEEGGEDGVLLRSFDIKKEFATGYDTFEDLLQDTCGEKWLLSSLFQYIADMNTFEEVNFSVSL